MGEGKYYWLKLHRDFFKRHDIKVVEAMPNGKDYILFYLKLLVESVDHEGNLRFSESIPYSADMLSAVTNTNVDVVKGAIKVFTELGMITILPDSTIYMEEVNRMLGCETKWAEKKRNQRMLPKLTNGSARVNADTMRLPNGQTRYVDEKRYGGNGMLVLDRAQGKCEICGSEENVVIHHNNGYSNEPEDLICLCSKCHGKVHSREGGQCPPPVLTMSDKSKSKRESKSKNNREFIPPTLEEVEAYCKERGNKVNPQAFFDYFTTGNWKDSKGNPVKNWKQKIITWEKYEPKTSGPKQNSFNQMINHGYDFDEIERMVLSE